MAGAIKSIIGEYRLTPVDADSTRVNYRLEVRVCVNESTNSTTILFTTAINTVGRSIYYYCINRVFI